MFKEYPLKIKTRKFEMCTCGHGGDSHNSSWFTWGDCKICECPKYEINPDSVGEYQECEQGESDMSCTNYCGKKIYYKKVKT